MGLLARLFSNSPAARLERSRLFFEKGRYNDVRLELEGVEGEEAARLRQESLAALAAMNLEEARACLESRDPEGAQEHLELAQEFGASPEALREVRRLARDLREADARRQQQAASDAPQPLGEDPLWQLPPDHPRLRYAILVEGYPDALREKLMALDEGFSSAVIQIEEGNAAHAFAALEPYVAQTPVARFERARAALAAGLLPAAASDLLTFGREVGHQRIGAAHTAVMLAGLLAQLGRAGEALEVVEAEQRKAPDPASALELEATRSSLLELTGRLPEAASATAALLRQAPRQMGLYRQLARIREKLGERVGAMQALEAGLGSCCSSPGQCGNQPLDLAAVRALARLYLEDRLEPKRAAELVDKLARNVQEPTWEDHYIAALVARNADDPEASQMASRLVAGLNEGDPRVRLVSAAFGL